VNSGTADNEKLNESSQKVSDAIQKQREAIESAGKAQAQSNEILSRASDLNTREQAAITRGIGLLQNQASYYERVAASSSESASRRVEAGEKQVEVLNKIAAATDKAANKEFEALKIQKAQGLLTEDEYFSERTALADKYAAKRSRIDDQIAASGKEAFEQQKKVGDELVVQLDKVTASLTSVEKMMIAVNDAVSKIDFSAVADTLGPAFATATTEAIKLRDEIAGLQTQMNNLTSKDYTIKISKEVGGGASGEWETEEKRFGGLAGRAAATYVSAGEGFVPPGFVKSHLPTLQALNAGNAVPFNGAIPLSRFVGPAGIDNIKTSLPRGSFVLSKRGMEAVERATGAVSERNKYQMGGVVTGETETATTTPQQMQDKAMFELTLNLGGGETRKYPLYGSRAVVKEIQDHLERETMTKL
jgi:hypothetical protein